MDAGASQQLGVSPSWKSLIMPEERPPDASDLYTERVIRSVAHNIGNLVNVISGRLSLLELQDGIGTEALQVIGLMRDRLRRTQGELRQAVKFVSETTKLDSRVELAASSVMSYLTSALSAIPGGIRGFEELVGNARAESCISTYPLTHPLTALSSGLGKLSQAGETATWELELVPEGLVLRIEVPDSVLPADRRSILEPWFDAKLHHGLLEVQKGRLEVAVALGWFEDGGAQISTTSVKDVSQVRVLWHFCAV